MNKLELSGYIGNVELSYTSNGKAKASFYVKFTNGKDENGNWTYDFFNCIAWGDTAESINVLETSMMYDVRGKLQSRSYTDKAGNSRKYYELVAFEVTPTVFNTEPSPKVAATLPGKRTGYTHQGNSARTNKSPF